MKDEEGFVSECDQDMNLKFEVAQLPMNQKTDWVSLVKILLRNTRWQ